MSSLSGQQKKVPFILLILAFVLAPLEWSWAKSKGKGLGPSKGKHKTAVGKPDSPPGWSKNRAGWYNDLPHGLAKKEGWLPPGWNKGEKEGWKDQYPPGWDKWSKEQQERWQAEVAASVNEVAAVCRKHGRKQKTIEAACISVELMSRSGIPPSSAKRLVIAGVTQGFTAEGIERVAKACGFGAYQGLEGRELATWAKKRIEAGDGSIRVAKEVYEKVQRYALQEAE